MSDSHFDFVVIGGGSAGYAAAGTAVRLGLKTVVIEGGEEVGGLCILRGCMPSKTLLESGHRAEGIRRAEEFGLRADYRGFDGQSIRDRKRALIADFAGYRKEQLESGRFAFIRGRASFVDAHTVEVALLDGGSQRIDGRAFLIATGSEINWIDLPGLRETGVLTSDDVLDSDHVPESVVILGAGPTGLEFASYYAGLGSKVTVLQRSGQLLKDSDPDVGHALSAALSKRGIQVFTNTQLLGLEKREGGGKRVRYRHLDAEHAAEAEEIIYSLGRRPNTRSLNLQAAGVEVEKWGAVRINACQQSSVPHIFAAGDVSGPFEVVHIAIQQAEVAARNAARELRGEAEPLESTDYSLKLFAVFTHPEIAMVGLSAREATEQGLDFIEAVYPFADHGKSMVRGETDGFVKLLATSDTRRIIGGAVIGPEASELIHEIVVAMSFGATAAQLAQVPHYHPTLSEIWTYPAEALAEA